MSETVSLASRDLMAGIEGLGHAINGAENYAPRSFNVESDPDLSTLRAQARQEAEAVMAAHVRHLCEGDYDKVPMEADAGGTARKLVAIGHVFGKHSPEYNQGWQALLRDCERRVAEAWRANSWELFGVTQMEFDHDTDEFYCDGFSVSEMARNGLTPATNPNCPEEGQCRINEYVEVATDATLVSRPEMSGYGCFTIAQCPQSVIDRYNQDPSKRVHSDYVPAIEKMMVRFKWFDPANSKVYFHQMAVPGKYINNEVVNLALTRMKVIEGRLDRTQIRGTQALVSRECIDSAVDMVEFLDSVASDYHGIPIFLGEPLPQGSKPDYDDVYMQAEQRRREQDALTKRYAQYLVELEESGLDRELVKHEADAYIRSELLHIAQLDPIKAAEMFDDQTARGFYAAIELEAQGLYQQAAKLRQEVAKNAPAAGGCGAGTCGLEELSSQEASATKDLLGTNTGEQALKDSERPCAKCGSKAVVYVGSKKSWANLKKGCLNCKATEGAKRPAKPALSFTIRRPSGLAKVTANQKTAFAFQI